MMKLSRALCSIVLLLSLLVTGQREGDGAGRQDSAGFQLFEPQEGSIPSRHTAASAPEGASLENAAHDISFNDNEWAGLF